MGICAPGRAADWTVTPRLTLAETYSDNVNLAHDDADREEDLITEITPGVSVAGEGARSRLDLNYRMQNLLYARDSDRNNIFHQLEADGDVELAKETLFVESRASYTQQLLSPDEQPSLRNINVAGRRSDVGTFEISPHAVTRFGDLAVGRARYTHDEVFFDRGGASDTQSDTYRAELSEGARFNDFGWSLSYERRDEKRRGLDETIRLETSTARVNWRATSKLSLFVSGGYERNDFRQQGGETEGSFWSTGFSLAPSARTSLTVSRGERFFGTTWNLDLSHRTRTSRWSAFYTESVTTFQQLQLQRRVFVLTDEFGDPILNQRGQPLVFETTFPQPTDEVFVEKHAGLSVAKDTGKSTFSLNVDDRRREFQQTDEEDRTLAISTGWRWRFATRTRSMLRALWQRHEPRLTDAESDLWDVSLRLMRRIRPRVDGSLEYSYTVRDGEDAQRDYVQNVITARLSMTF